NALVMRGWIVTLVLASLLYGQMPKSKLLPTESVAIQVGAIQKQLFDRDSKLTDTARNRLFERIRTLVSNFVITQLEAEPRIEWWQLRQQLGCVLSEWQDEPYYVFRAPRTEPDGPTVWAVLYKGHSNPGLAGDRTVVDAFVVDRGKVRMERGGPE